MSTSNVEGERTWPIADFETWIEDRYGGRATEKTKYPYEFWHGEFGATFLQTFQALLETGLDITPIPFKGVACIRILER